MLSDLIHSFLFLILSNMYTPSVKKIGPSIEKKKKEKKGEIMCILTALHCLLLHIPTSSLTSHSPVMVNEEIPRQNPTKILERTKRKFKTAL